ncbi:MAG: hypothetical protein COA59_10345 [Colwellia sp.]|jgi:hypothetical protein|nr:MAG: hypothetical protein COA59_10345 [Colwellia sp.]
MALYSWFSKNNNKPNKKSIRAKNNLLKASESAKYIENYTMWPTAKIKKNIVEVLPESDDIKEELTKNSDESKSTLEENSISFKTTLIVNK